MLPRIVAGDTLTHTVTLTDYPASAGWVLSFRLAPRGPGAAATFNAAADGDDHVVTVAASTTASWAPGDYTAAAWVTLATERYSVASESGQVRIWPNPATIGAGADTRSQAEKALDDARAAFAAWSPTTRSYVIGGRQMQFNSPSEIVTVIDHWSREVQREQRAAGIAAGLGSTKGKVYVRMGRA